MEKTTVYLTTDQKRALERAAQATGRSEARLIRAGIEAVTAPRGIAESATRLVDERPPDVGDGGDAVARRPRWMLRDELVRLLALPADAGLRTQLGEMAPGTTDDAAIR